MSIKQESSTWHSEKLEKIKKKIITAGKQRRILFSCSTSSRTTDFSGAVAAELQLGLKSPTPQSVTPLVTQICSQSSGGRTSSRLFLRLNALLVTEASGRRRQTAANVCLSPRWRSRASPEEAGRRGTPGRGGGYREQRMRRRCDMQTLTGTKAAAPRRKAACDKWKTACEVEEEATKEAKSGHRTCQRTQRKTPRLLHTQT